MIVKELIELLQNYPMDYEVIMSSDSEGNNFSPLSDLCEAIYVAETTWCGELKDPEDTEQDNNAVVLWSMA